MRNLWSFATRCAHVVALAFALCPPGHARVTRIVIDETAPMAAPAGSPNAAIAYEQIAGSAFGELDTRLAGNAIIQDINLGRDADGKVRYVASFVIYKPVDLVASLAGSDQSHALSAREALPPGAMSARFSKRPRPTTAAHQNRSQTA